MSADSNEPSEAVAQGTGHKRVQTGIVTSDVMDKTVVVTVERIGTHPLYKKVVRRRKKYMAHDQDNACRVGDRVRLVECRPMSARKRWRVAEIIQRAPGIDVAEVAE